MTKDIFTELADSCFPDEDVPEEKDDAKEEEEQEDEE